MGKLAQIGEMIAALASEQNISTENQAGTPQVPKPLDDKSIPKSGLECTTRKESSTKRVRLRANFSPVYYGREPKLALVPYHRVGSNVGLELRQCLAGP